MGQQWAPGQRVETGHVGRWLDERSKLLAIGSCFAVNFARWIALHGVDIRRPDWGLHYNPSSILAELAQAAGERSIGDITYVQPSPDGSGARFIDAHRHPVAATSLEELEAVRSGIAQRAKLAFESADSFLVTLGVGEVWEALDRRGAWVTLNRSPPTGDASGLTLRSRFADVHAIERDIATMIELIRSHHGDVPITFTVSPIPLKETFSGLPIVQANTLSKSVLIAGLHAALATARDPAVAYFPAYELFWGPEQEEVKWQRDGRHPTAAAIDLACRRFVDAFATEREHFTTRVAFSVKQV